MPQSLAALYCHFVWSIKGRENWIDAELEPQLYAYIGGILSERKGRLMAAGGIPDHVHLLVSLGREWVVSDLVRDIKANSSGWIQATLPALAHFAWQNGYGAFSVSASQLAVVERYIGNQKAHHADRSYQEEFCLLLAKHGIEYDERYVWG
jgi:REP element-mobilizing transposase RayT